MKWFKHISGSLNDSFIFSLIERFGGDGYLVFFGTLELMADEFDIKNPGISHFTVKKLTKNLQISRRKLTEILKFTTEKGRLIADINRDKITLNCPRLKKLCDNWTQSQLRSNCEVNKKSLPPKEVEVEEDKENTLKGIKEIPPHEYEKLVNDFGEEIILDYLERFKLYVKSSGKTFDDAGATIRLWLKRDKVNPNPVKVKDGKDKKDKINSERETYRQKMIAKNKILQKHFQKKVINDPELKELKGWEVFIKPLVITCYQEEDKTLLLFHENAKWITEHFHKYISRIVNKDKSENEKITVMIVDEFIF